MRGFRSISYLRLFPDTFIVYFQHPIVKFIPAIINLVLKNKVSEDYWQIYRRFLYLGVKVICLCRLTKTLEHKAMLLSSLPNQWYCGCSWYWNVPRAMLSISFPLVFCHMCSITSFKNIFFSWETCVPSFSLDSLSLIWPQQVVGSANSKSFDKLPK